MVSLNVYFLTWREEEFDGLIGRLAERVWEKLAAVLLHKRGLRRDGAFDAHPGLGANFSHEEALETNGRIPCIHVGLGEATLHDDDDGGGVIDVENRCKRKTQKQQTRKKVRF